MLGRAKNCKQPRKFKKDTSTVVEQDRIVAEAEELKSQGRACATSSVSMRLKGLQIPFGEKPQKTRGAKHEDLQRQFSKLCAVCIDALDDHNIKFELLETEPVACWIQCRNALPKRTASSLTTSDAMYCLELLGHKYGLVSDFTN